MTETEVFALIVEDLPDNTEILERILAFHGRDFQSVATAEEALVVLSVLRPRVIIADLALPQMSGWELLGEVRSIPHLADIPIVAVTAYHSTHVEREVIELGFNAYIPKPLDTASFIATIDQIIDDYRQINSHIQRNLMERD